MVAGCAVDRKGMARGAIQEMTEEDKKPPKRRSGRRRKPEYESYDEAWDGSTDDRLSYNLGDGSRRVPPKGAAE